MARVLVTGAGGYIGTTLVPTLLEKGYQVRALDRFFFGRELLREDPGIEVVQEDSRKIRPEHLAGTDAVVDLAALSNDPSSELFQKETWEINCEARVRTATLAKEQGVQRYILPSSCSVYGFQSNGHARRFAMEADAARARRRGSDLFSAEDGSRQSERRDFQYRCKPE